MSNRWIEILNEPEGLGEPTRPALPMRPMSRTHARILAAADAEFAGFFGVPLPPVRVNDPLTGVDDREGPMQPEYSERDDEALDEMERQDMEGLN